jgi:hypothetical protein
MPIPQTERLDIHDTVALGGETLDHNVHFFLILARQHRFQPPEPLSSRGQGDRLRHRAQTLVRVVQALSLSVVEFDVQTIRGQRHGTKS